LKRNKERIPVLPIIVEQFSLYLKERSQVENEVDLIISLLLKKG
jgi:integrase/recombinase XerC